jgi:hypothetical protein
MAVAIGWVFGHGWDIKELNGLFRLMSGSAVETANASADHAVVTRSEHCGEAYPSLTSMPGGIAVRPDFNACQATNLLCVPVP